MSTVNSVSRAILLMGIFCFGCNSDRQNVLPQNPSVGSVSGESEKPKSEYELREEERAKDEANLKSTQEELNKEMAKITPKQRAHLKDWERTEKYYEGIGYLPDEAAIKADEQNGPKWPEPLSQNFVQPMEDSKEVPKPASRP
jgi:hypothetical protein